MVFRGLGVVCYRMDRSCLSSFFLKSAVLNCGCCMVPYSVYNDLRINKDYDCLGKLKSTFFSKPKALSNGGDSTRDPGEEDAGPDSSMPGHAISPSPCCSGNAISP